MLTRYMLKCPQVELFIESTNRRVDLLHEGFDIAPAGALSAAGEHRHGDEGAEQQHPVLVGQPQYLEQLPKGFDPQLLGTLPSVHWGSAQRGTSGSCSRAGQQPQHRHPAYAAHGD
jgi:DNA-binding transcriptional LysR family regulator